MSKEESYFEMVVRCLKQFEEMAVPTRHNLILTQEWGYLNEVAKTNPSLHEFIIDLGALLRTYVFWTVGSFVPSEKLLHKLHEHNYTVFPLVKDAKGDWLVVGCVTKVGTIVFTAAGR